MTIVATPGYNSGVPFVRRSRRLLPGKQQGGARVSNQNSRPLRAIRQVFSRSCHPRRVGTIVSAGADKSESVVLQMPLARTPARDTGARCRQIRRSSWNRDNVVLKSQLPFRQTAYTFSLAPCKMRGGLVELSCLARRLCQKAEPSCKAVSPATSHRRSLAGLTGSPSSFGHRKAAEPERACVPVVTTIRTTCRPAPKAHRRKAV